MTRPRPPALAVPRRRAPARRAKAADGLASLEWLLVIAAVGGFAAVMATAAQHVVDDAAETRTDPAARLIEARVHAAEISRQAVDVERNSDPAFDSSAALADLKHRCEQIGRNHPEAVAAAAWTQATVTDTAADGTPALQWACRVTGKAP